MSRPKKIKSSSPASSGSSRAKQIRSLRGMRDILPGEVSYWRFINKTAEDLLEVYGFSKIETPILENLDLFARGVGNDSDIVSKEMFSFVDKGGDKVCLRPENTASVVRAYIEHGMVNKPQPIKLYYSGPQFRHEKPQSGRYRQFHQLGLEVIGDGDALIDAQVILFTHNFFTDLRLDFSLQINSLGCKDCRKKYNKDLKIFYTNRKRFICKDCQKRLDTNPLRLLDCKEEECQKIAQEAPQIVDYLCEDCNAHFVKTLEYLDELNIPYELNPGVVRGLDYYTKTIFEVWAKDTKGNYRKTNALGGGGRYDKLVEVLGGQSTPGMGVAFGIERIIAQLRDQEIKIPQKKDIDIFLIQIGQAAKKKCLSLFEELRKNKFNVGEALSKDGLRQQLDKANKVRAKFTLILGQQELLDNTIILRNMQDGTQETIGLERIVDNIRQKMKSSKVKTIKLDRVENKIAKPKAVKNEVIKKSSTKKASAKKSTRINNSKSQKVKKVGAKKKTTKKIDSKNKIIKKVTKTTKKKAATKKNKK